MSKIYEALRQAERDRAEAQKHQRDGGAAVLTEGEYPIDADARAAVPGSPQPQAVRGFSAGSDLLRPLEMIPGEELSPALAEPALNEPALAVPAAVQAPPELEPRTAPTEPLQTGLPAVLCEWKPILSNLPALEQRGSQVEQFRSLRSKLFEFRDLNKLKVLMVSSGRPAEGKSFVASNLALTLARHRSARVLLIDGDMRRSSLHFQFGTTNQPGLGDYLAGKATLAQILQRGSAPEGARLPAALATLSFIPAGNGGDKAADLSGSPRFKELIATLSPHFDWIIVDSSPVNLVTDGINLARACDAVLLIVRAGLTRYETAQRALAELKASKVLGVVLNAVDNSQKPDTYYGYDSHDTTGDSQDTKSDAD